MQGVAIYPVETLGQLIAHLNGEQQIEPYRADPCLLAPVEYSSYEQDIATLRGQEHVKRALAVAASGGHNIVLSGPPGSGKSLLARCLPSLLPRMSIEEALDVTRIYSVSGMLPTAMPLVVQRPFRELHPPVSQEGLVGEDSIPVPGEMSLAHQGVLFLDELAECGQREQEVLCQALEDKVVSIAREQGTVVYPASFLLIASMRPCPCGFFSDPINGCTCSATAIARYQKRMHARLLDHIDLHVEVPRVDYEQLAERRNVETSEVVRRRVEAARDRQQRRLVGTKVTCNAAMGATEVRAFCQMEASAEKPLQAAKQQLKLTVRSSQRTLKLARTIADLAESELIKANHIAEAQHYRMKVGQS
jgi:magnesium chelatase family protein